MGPCLFRHGNTSQVGLIALATEASMGPCLFRHGNPYQMGPSARDFQRFNGAVPFQARKLVGDFRYI